MSGMNGMNRGMNKTERIGIGIIGTKFAGRFHADMWRTIPEVEIVAIAGRNDEVRRAFKEEYEVPRDYKSYEDLIIDPAVDLVDICLPNFLHAGPALESLRTGKDVICEKPLATSLKDAEAIVKTQEDTARRFFYAEDWIFAPSLVRARGIIEEGGIGDLLYCKGKETHNGSHSPFAQKIEFCGGGAMIHLGIHAVGFFHDLFGLPDRVLGTCSGGGEQNLVHKELEGEDWGVGVLSYNKGLRVLVEGNYITCGGMDDAVEFYGTEGLIKVDLTFGSPISVYSRKGYGYALEKTDFTHGWTRPAVNEFESLGYRDELRHFISCLLGEEQQRSGTTARAGLNTLMIIDALYRSHRGGRAIEF